MIRPELLAVTDIGRTVFVEVVLEWSQRRVFFEATVVSVDPPRIMGRMNGGLMEFSPRQCLWQEELPAEATILITNPDTADDMIRELERHP